MVGSWCHRCYFAALDNIRVNKKCQPTEPWKMGNAGDVGHQISQLNLYRHRGVIADRFAHWFVSGYGWYLAPNLSGRQGVAGATRAGSVPGSSVQFGLAAGVLPGASAGAWGGDGSWVPPVNSGANARRPSSPIVCLRLQAKRRVCGMLDLLLPTDTPSSVPNSLVYRRCVPWRFRSLAAFLPAGRRLL